MRGSFRRPGAAVVVAVVIWVSAVCLQGSGGATTSPAAPLASGADWPGYLFNPGHSSFNRGARSITPANTNTLAPVWKWTPPPPNPPGSTYMIVNASPSVAGGRVYVGSETGVFSALDETTGSVVWQRFLGFVPQLTCAPPLGITSTGTVAVDPATGNATIYVAGGDGYMYALNAADGSIVWRSAVGVPSTTVNDYYNWGSPVVANGHVYMGVSSDCDNPLVHGGLKEYDQATGAVQATWNALPLANLGGSIWSSPAAAGDGSIIVTTGNGMGKVAPADSNSVVRLAGSDLARLDGWQVPFSQQVQDSDFGGSPTLFTASLSSVATPMVGACNKNGFYYAFRRLSLSAGPVWSFKMADASGVDPGPGQCDAAAIWDGTSLIEGGNGTTIAGVQYPGSVRALDPATGTPRWETGLPGQVIGSPTEDGAGVVAAAVFKSSTAQYGVWLLGARTGKVLGVLTANNSPVFAQPVFAGNNLFLAGQARLGVTEYQITTPGPPLTSVVPSAIGRGAVTNALTITGSNFATGAIAVVSSWGVTVNSTTVLSATSIEIKVTVASQAPLGARDVTVINPSREASSCTGCLTVDLAPVIGRRQLRSRQPV